MPLVDKIFPASSVSLVAVPYTAFTAGAEEVRAYGSLLPAAAAPPHPPHPRPAAPDTAHTPRHHDVSGSLHYARTKACSK